MSITRDVAQQMVVLAESIAQTIEDYANNDFCDENDKDHVLKWVSQFDENDRLFVLQQTDLLLKRQYFTKDNFETLLDKAIKQTASKVLHDISFLDVQLDGRSQSDMLEILNNSCLNTHKFPININDYTKDKFIYQDDVIFTGDRVCRDLEEWINNTAPHKCSLLIVSLYAHTSALYNIENKLTNIINTSGKSISLSLVCAGRTYENKFIMRNQSDVFWPKEENVIIPDNLDPIRFTSTAPQGQAPGRTGFAVSYVFRDENDRDRFEKILCAKGFYIISLCNNSAASMKPLGYKTYRGLGFGGTIFTYRNCPNNTPLVFWWGNPDMDERNPLSKWYPLMMRKTY
ncbi:phosphoribosyltransferase-like protein [Proteus terrae]|uniref:phosphoribosyltransferase-like protein n=1 Tax=Proteus terrae TaxID=1574161 RepID=UPI0032DABE57